MVHTLRAKHPRAHEVSPVDITLTGSGPLTPDLAQAVRRSLGFGLPEEQSPFLGQTRRARAGTSMVRRKVNFFDEVREACADMADDLKLTGPQERDLILPSSSYKGAGVEYRFRIDGSEGSVDCTVEMQTETVTLIVDIESLAIAAGVVEKRGGVSYSARNLNQLRKSLQGQAEYVRRVHPFLADPATAENLMRQADAREWPRRDT